MPDFSKIALKPIESNKKLTMPEGFELASQTRHKQAVDLQREKVKLQLQKEQLKRQFKSKPLPDYERMEMCIMPSEKPSTVAMKPAFASDRLPKKIVKNLPVQDNGTSSPADFKF